jgi:PRTRC genetic system ThiF family protein
MSTSKIDPNYLDLDYLNSCKLLLPVTDMVSLVLVGCGGTGSWLAPHVARVARLLVEKFHKETQVFFYDPDQVEEKNIYRQSFSYAEIGQNKAQALAWRYGLAWGLEIVAVPKAYEAGKLSYRGSLAVVIGCVDNAAGRTAIRDDVQHSARTWWLDCGNTRSAGQVLVGSGYTRPEDPYQLPGFCTWLPLPSARHPELLEALPGEGVSIETGVSVETVAPQNMSCAEMALADSQGLAINARMAAEAADYLVRMLVTKDLRKWGTYIDLASGSARSKYITKDH